MNPTLEQLERAFPGKGQEISNLIEKRTLTTSYASVLALISKYQDTPPPYYMCLMTAIAEVLGNVDWFAPPRVGFWHDDYMLNWHFINECVVLTKGN